MRNSEKKMYNANNSKVYRINNNSNTYYKKGFNINNSQFNKQKVKLDIKEKRNNLYFNIIKYKQNPVNKAYGFNKYELIELNDIKNQIKINSSKIINNYVENKKNYLLKINSTKKTNQSINEKKLIQSNPYYNNIKFKNEEKKDYNIHKEKYNTTFYDINEINKQLESINKSSNNIIKIKENNEFYHNLESKIYKKAIKQSFNKLIKFCYSIIKNDLFEFLNLFKNKALKNTNNQKAYIKKNIKNKNIYKILKTPLNSSKKETFEKDFSSISSIKTINVAKLRIDESVNSLFNSSNKKREYKPSYYNFINLEEKESYSNSIQNNMPYNLYDLKKNIIKNENELKSDIYIKKKIKNQKVLLLIMFIFHQKKSINLTKKM